MISDKDNSNETSKYEEENEEINENLDDLGKSNSKLSKTSKSRTRQRQENSLGELTKSVINYIKQRKSKEIHINEVVRKLKVKKRRIYDITNVLEGIGCIKKLAKNKIMWLDESLYKDYETNGNHEIEKMHSELISLTNEEKNLNKWINELKSSYEKIYEEPDFKNYGFLTYNDIKFLSQGDDVNLIGIRAPSGTSIETPEPENVYKLYLETKENMLRGEEKMDKDLLDSLEKKYQLFLESPNGEITVYLVLSSSSNEKPCIEREKNYLNDSKYSQNENFDQYYFQKNIFNR